MSKIRIEHEPWARMVAHAEATYPNECCGAMIGIEESENVVQFALPLENSFEGSQAQRYLISKADMERADVEARKINAKVLGFYHSHPNCDAYFSKTDLQHSNPWFSFVVLSIRNGGFDHVRCFRPDLDLNSSEEEELSYA